MGDSPPKKKRGRPKGSKNPPTTLKYFHQPDRLTCYVCKESKPLSAFTKAPSKPSGYFNACKPCHSKLTRLRGYRKILRDRGESGILEMIADYEQRLTELRELLQVKQ